MEQKTFILLDTTDTDRILAAAEDDSVVTAIPAMVVLAEEHIEEIARLMELHRYAQRPAATILVTDLTDESFTAGPAFIPLDERIIEEFGTPETIKATIDPAGMQFHMQVIHDGGWHHFSDGYSDRRIKLEDIITGKTTVHENFVEWLKEGRPDIDYIRKTIGEENFREMLDESGIEEQEIAATGECA
jgi:hypothetical protein